MIRHVVLSFNAFVWFIMIKIGHHRFRLNEWLWRHWEIDAAMRTLTTSKIPKNQKPRLISWFRYYPINNSLTIADQSAALIWLSLVSVLERYIFVVYTPLAIWELEAPTWIQCCSRQEGTNFYNNFNALQRATATIKALSACFFWTRDCSEKMFSYGKLVLDDIRTFESNSPFNCL